MSDLRTRMGISNVEDTIRYNRLRWFGHLQRMDEEKWSRKILNFEINGSYPRGRSKKRWFDNLINCDYLLLLTLDRVKWRNAIKPCCRVQPPLSGKKKDMKLDRECSVRYHPETVLNALPQI